MEPIINKYQALLMSKATLLKVNPNNNSLNSNNNNNPRISPNNTSMLNSIYNNNNLTRPLNKINRLIQELFILLKARINRFKPNNINNSQFLKVIYTTLNSNSNIPNNSLIIITNNILKKIPITITFLNKI
jgi:hypothetical protein